MAAESFLVQALSALIADFNRRGIEYALTGGWAFSALVEPRATTDIDLLILIEQPSREGIQSLLAPLFDSTVVHPAPMPFRGISIWRIGGIRNHQEVIVDLLLTDSEYLRTALARCQTIQFDQLQVPILTIEDLILLKTMAARLQDQADLQKIHARRDELQVVRVMSRGEIKLGLRGQQIFYRCEYQRKPLFCSVKLAWGTPPGFSRSSTLKSMRPNQAGSAMSW